MDSEDSSPFETSPVDFGNILMGGGDRNLQSDNQQSSTAVDNHDTANSNRSIDFPSSSSGNPTANNAPTANNIVLPQSLQPSETLSYPYDFFSTKTGLGPKNGHEAVSLWPFRKHRPARGMLDPEPADGMKMYQEVQGMSERLKSHIENTFMKDARAMARVWKLQDPRTNQAPHTRKDFVRALVALKRVEGSLDNERIVYMVCHHFHHQREWLSHAVDAWCRDEKIKIEYPSQEPEVVDGKRKRSSPSNRGGFGVYARNIKSEIVKQLMRNMLSRTGWSIATKDNSKQGKGKKYEAIKIRIESTLTDHTCYVVTEEDAAKKAAGKNKDGGSVTMGSSADNPIEVDHFVGIGAHICSNLGVSVSEARLQEMYCNYKPPSDVVGLHIGTGTKSPGGDMSDLTGGEAAAAFGSTYSAAPPMTVAHTHQQPMNTTAAHTYLPANSTAAHPVPPSFTTATGTHLPVRGSAAHPVPPSLTTGTGTHLPVSGSAAHPVPPSLTTGTGTHLPVSGSAAHSVAPSLTTATGTHQPGSSTAARFTAQTAMASILLLGAPVGNCCSFTRLLTCACAHQCLLSSWPQAVLQRAAVLLRLLTGLEVV